MKAGEKAAAENQDYEYYKLGIEYYKNIHPNAFYKTDSGGTFKTKTYNELEAALNSIFLSFNLSEFYFKKVIEEYPKSVWLEDAANKITLLKKLRKKYENITMEENMTTNYAQFVNEMGLKIMR